jgi:hypothetical protein
MIPLFLDPAKMVKYVFTLVILFFIPVTIIQILTYNLNMLVPCLFFLILYSVLFTVIKYF